MEEKCGYAGQAACVGVRCKVLGAGEGHRGPPWKVGRVAATLSQECVVPSEGTAVG